MTARLEGDRILFTIGSQELVAKNTAGLKIGQRVLAQVQPGRTQEGEMILQVLGSVPEESAAAAKLKTVLAVKSDLGPVLEELKNVLRDLPAKTGFASGQGGRAGQIDPGPIPGPSGPQA